LPDALIWRPLRAHAGTAVNFRAFQLVATDYYLFHSYAAIGRRARGYRGIAIRMCLPTCQHTRQTQHHHLDTHRLPYLNENDFQSK
jgi:hypothetical protein